MVSLRRAGYLLGIVASVAEYQGAGVVCGSAEPPSAAPIRISTAPATDMRNGRLASAQWVITKIRLTNGMNIEPRPHHTLARVAERYREYLTAK